MSRSQSRGREFASAGRGGVGNIRPQSRDPIPRGPDDLRDFSPSRGREFRNTYDEPVSHSGRGGAGNIRSPSRDPEGERKGYEADRKLVKDYDSSQHIHSSGRGGVGNIDRSRSRDPSHNNKTHHGGAINSLIDRISHDDSREHTHSTEHHTSGRGGYGNTYEGDPLNANVLERKEEGERVTYKNSVDDSGAHSAGRGGYGNTSSAVGTGVYDTQAPHHSTSEHDVHATGRGGAGNITNSH